MHDDYNLEPAELDDLPRSSVQISVVLRARYESESTRAVLHLLAACRSLALNNVKGAVSLPVKHGYRLGHSAWNLAMPIRSTSGPRDLR